MTGNLSETFFYLSIFSLSVYFLGFFLFSFFSKETVNGKLEFFYSLLIGSLTITILHAIITTRYNTVLTILSFFILIYFIIYKPKINSLETFKKKLKNLNLVNIFSFLVILFVTLSIQYYKIYGLSNETITLIHEDYIFYGRQSLLLLKSNIEAVNPDLINLGNAPRPYHYGDLWFASIFIKHLNFNSISAYFLGYIPFYFTTLIFGVNSFITIVFEKKKHALLVSFFIILITNITFLSEPIINHFISGESMNTNLYNIPKLSLVYCWFIFAIIKL